MGSRHTACVQRAGTFLVGLFWLSMASGNGLPALQHLPSITSAYPQGLVELRQAIGRGLLAASAQPAVSRDQLGELHKRWSILQQAGLSLWANAANASERAALQQLLNRVGLLSVGPVWDPRYTAIEIAPPSLAPDPKPADLRVGDTVNQPTLVHFWAQWCAPCRAELPELATFYQDEYLTLQEVGLRLLTVNADPVLPNDGAPLPVQHDPDFALYRSLAQTDSVALPATFLLLPGGVRLTLAYGRLQWQADTLLPRLKPHLTPMAPAGVALLGDMP